MRFEEPRLFLRYSWRALRKDRRIKIDIHYIIPPGSCQESIKHIYETRPEFITRDSLLITAVIKKHPKIAEFLFNTLFETLPASNANSVYIVLKSLFTIIKKADKKTSALLADKILNTPQNIQKIIREQHISGLYIDAPHLRKKLFKIIVLWGY